MQTPPALVTALVISALVVCGFAVFALVESIRTLRDARRLHAEVGERLIPLIEKVDVTVDAVNAELLRIDGIVSTFEDVSDKVSTTTNVVHGAMNAPLEAVNAVGSRLRDVWRTARRMRS
ncbi:MAG: hypothetical protein U1E22_07420 [Coriobacteriia bacterium]|nr:hypothetical protein [Coriobacteriia bacterium]